MGFKSLVSQSGMAVSLETGVGSVESSATVGFADYKQALEAAIGHQQACTAVLLLMNCVAN